VTEARLAARGLAWAVGDRYVLLDLELALPAGRFVAISGGNGSGKTTLLHLLAGRIRPTGGAVLLDGADLRDLEPGYVGRRIGWLGHKPGLYLDLSAHENVALFASVSGRPLSDADVTGLLDRVGLGRLDHHRPVRGFSRGMKQRAGLARVLATGADVWLLDEPTTGLDHEGREVLVRTLRDVVDSGATVFAASHIDSFIAAADEHLHLESGRLHRREAA